MKCPATSERATQTIKTQLNETLEQVDARYMQWNGGKSTKTTLMKTLYHECNTITSLLGFRAHNLLITQR